MFSLRRLTGIVLLVAVMASGFVLFDTFFVQEARAQSETTECDTAYAFYKAVKGFRDAICGLAGSNSYECFLMEVQVAYALLEMQIAC